MANPARLAALQADTLRTVDMRLGRIERHLGITDADGNLVAAGQPAPNAPGSLQTDPQSPQGNPLITAPARLLRPIQNVPAIVTRNSGNGGAAGPKKPGPKPNPARAR